MAAVFIICIPTREYELKLDERKASSGSTTWDQKIGIASNVHNGGDRAHSRAPPCNGTDPAANLVDIKTPWGSIEAVTAPSSPEKGEDIPPLVPPRQPPPSLPQQLPAVQLRNNSGGESISTSSVDECLETVLKIGLNKLKIEGAVWQPTEDKKFIQIVFPCESQERCEIILRHLCGNGIGIRKESIVSVVPCSVYYQAGDDDDDDGDSAAELCGDTKDSDTFHAKEKTQKTEFLKSIKARLTVAQVVDGVRGGATLTFDYVAFVILANFIAAFGLMDSSVVAVVASMLVSPLMGPIMALCFGTVIRDMSLLRLGIKSECVGLFICLSVGVILGLIMSPWGESWGRGLWPTAEMFSRGQARGLWVGMLVALPSGAGVALSLLGGNAGSLVGVAISASLLPPAVNAGLLWAHAVVLTFRSVSENSEVTIMYNGESLSNKPSLLPPPNYVCQYSTNMAYESATLGVISLCLTLINIACIVMMAIAVLKIKEVAPVSSMPATSRFWREDIKIARDYNKTVHRQDSTNLGAAIAKEWADKNGSSTDLVEMVQEAIEDDEVYRTVARCTASQYTLPPKSRDRLSSISHIERNGSFMQKKPAVWDVTFSSPTRVNTRRRTTMGVHPLTPPAIDPFECRHSRISFIAEALNPHYASHYLQDGGAATSSPPPAPPPTSSSTAGNAVRRIFSPNESGIGGGGAGGGGGGGGSVKNRFKVTKADDCSSLVASGQFRKHPIPVVPEEVQMDFRE